MGLWDKIRVALHKEKQDLDEAVDEWTTKGNAALDQRERELDATPIEKLRSEQQRANEIDDELDAIRKRIEGDKPNP